MSGTEFGKAGKYLEGTSDTEEGARLSWRAFKWLVVGGVCVVAGVGVWAIVPKWADVGSVETSKAGVLWVRTGGNLRITAERVSPGTAGTVTIRLTAAETGPWDSSHPQGFRVAKELSGSGVLRFDSLVPGDYAVKVVPAEGSTWLVDVKDHRPWWGLPW